MQNFSICTFFSTFPEQKLPRQIKNITFMNKSKTKVERRLSSQNSIELSKDTAKWMVTMKKLKEK